MAKQTNPETQLKKRITLLHNRLGTDKQKKTFDALYTEKAGNWDAIRPLLKEKDGFTPEVVSSLEFTHKLAEWTKDNPTLVAAFQKDNKVSTIRDIALQYDVKGIQNLLQTKKIDLPEDTDAEGYALQLSRELFTAAPSAVLQRMLNSDKESPVKDKAVRTSLTTFLDNQPDFNIRTTSVYEAIRKEDAFKGIEEQKEEVVAQLKNLQRVSAISPVAEAVPVLMKSNLVTAYQVSEMPEAQFVKTFSAQFGADGENTAKQIHRNAVSNRIQNEQTLIALRETAKGTGVAFIDQSFDVRRSKDTDVSVRKAVEKHHLSWDTLFADADLCECGECTSVYSAAAYYVDLLQYLRNNNLDPNAAGQVAIKSDPKDISGTVLQKLFDRRPDLGCLQLTCTNTNTILPYIDLVNEVLENYIVFNETKPVFNVEDEASSELLAQPQHINYDAYCILHKAVYPFTLPYHQPIDATRIFLNHLSTGRHELIKVFKSQRKKPLEPETQEDTAVLDSLQEGFLQRAYEAEFLHLTQEEYIILTREGFVSKTFWDKRCKKEHTQEEYDQEIGLKPVHEYYGYGSEADMLNENESNQAGLGFVKKQFLKRSGVSYADLVELLKTRYLNPMMPQGRALSMMQNIRFSYRYLQNLVDYNEQTPKEKYKKLFEAFEAGEIVSLLLGKSRKDPCNPPAEQDCNDKKELEQWVYCYFERIGKIIVLKDGCHCVNGTFYFNSGRMGSTSLKLLELEDGLEVNGEFRARDCKIFLNVVYHVGKEVQEKEVEIGEIDCKTGKISFSKHYEGLIEKLTKDSATLVYNNKTIGRIVNGQLIRTDFTETCDISKTRLVHLDGTPLTTEEYDRFHRFIRLWLKLGWTISETDSAIMGLSKPDEQGSCNDGMPDNTDCERITDNCGCDDGKEEREGCNDKWLLQPVWTGEINVTLISQLVSVKKLLDKTGLELIRLLSFWDSISTFGEKSLYKHLFLTHNLISIDKVFKADKNGNYLLSDAKMTDHIPVLMAALNLTQEDISVVMDYEGLDDQLTIENVSVLYRYRLLARALGLKITDFISVLPMFGNVFEHAAATLSFYDQWAVIDEAGFTYKQVNYLIQGLDDPLKPMAPDLLSVLKLAKTIYDGINTINETHKDLQPDPAIADPDEEQLYAKAGLPLVKAKAVLLYEQPVVDIIAGVLEGTTVYATNAPKAIAFTIDEDKSLHSKLKYDPIKGAIEITGILTDAEKTDFIGLNSNPLWAAALNRIEKQQQKLFREVLMDVFEPVQQELMAGDIKVNLIPDENGVFPVDTNTAPQKRLKFLEVFLPYLRKELIRRFIMDTLSGSTGLNSEVTEFLMTKVLQAGNPPEYLYDIFQSVQQQNAPAGAHWKGYLIPAADNLYTFIAKNSDIQPGIVLNGATLDWVQQEDPTNEWWSSSPVPLKAGKLYTIEVTGLDAGLEDLFWKTATSMPALIPASMLLPDFARDKTLEAFTMLKKVAIWINGLNFEADELEWLFTYPADFGDFDFNAISLAHFLRLADFKKLKNSIPERNISLIEFFKWVKQPDDVSLLGGKMESLTDWPKEYIGQLISEEHYNLNHPDHFANEINFLKLQEAIAVKDKIGMGIDLLFEWARPRSNFYKCHAIAENIRKAIRSQYMQEDWEQVVKPLNDQLRQHQRDALVAYLLVQEPLINWGVKDADSLFEFFLIDVQMSSCMETSRIKQAISSVQLFVQRCFLGLEREVGTEVLDHDRWEWMQRYRVWEANRKVFLYPENWIESNLRDDKSSFFKELEGELLQKDINKENVTDALKSYLYKVDEVANMEVVGLYIDGSKGQQWSEGSKLHVFSRTRNAPFFFYYRYLALDEGNWYPWEKMEVDIPSYDVTDEDGKITGNGCYLTPVAWNGRLLIFFPQIMNKTKPLPVTNSLESIAKAPADAFKPIEYREIKMGWSEYRNGKWTQKQISTYTIVDSPDYTTLIEKANDLKTAIAKQSEAEKKEEKIKQELDEERDNFNSVWSQGNVNDIGTAATKLINKNKEHKDSVEELATAKVKTEKAYKEFIEEPRPPLSDLEKYEFVPVVNNNPDRPTLGLRVFNNRNQGSIGSFEFEGTSLQPPTIDYPGDNSINVDNFHYSHNFIRSLQIGNLVYDYVFRKESDGTTLYNYINFFHSKSSAFLGRVNNPDLAVFFRNVFLPNEMGEAFGGYGESPDTTIYHELKRPYSIYNWELFFHAPMMLADALSHAQQFEEAMKWYHFVFNPMAAGNDAKRFWNFTPFKDIDSTNILEKIFNQLQPNVANEAISEWRNHPFMPHMVARSRPVAYMKWVVMKYLDNILEWGDYLFRQDTIESINQATQLYILAGHILGPRPHFIPKRGKIQPQTYLSMLGKWDAFSNAMTELELAAPYSSQTLSDVIGDRNEPIFANIFGFASTLYFCIPNNPKLTGYWDTIADRLYKIRHCENIEGVFRKLPLFEPPIDPALLVKAAAQGLSIGSVINDLNTPMPNYRFYYLLQKALELCSELKSLGNAMLSAIEKRDNETIALIRSRHENVMNKMVMEVKKQQLEEAQKVLEGLQENRKAPKVRLEYYLQLIGEDVSKVPDADNDLELPNSIEQPVEETGLKVSKYEKEDMDKSNKSGDLKLAAGITEALASILYAIPYTTVDAKPIGIGVGIEFGGINLGQITQAVTNGIRISSDHLAHQSSSAHKKGLLQRAMQDRIMQANSAAREIKQIDKQILSQQVRIEIANLEIANHQKQMDNAVEVEEFLKNKYTNEELYTWMRTSLRGLYRQVYNLTYELAKKAEKTYQFERGLTNSNIIQAGYWEEGRDGLLAGEQLYIGLKKLEASYQNEKGYDYEITKNVSLRQINPLAVLQLKETGTCEFELPEFLYDMDYPGHYNRRIKSVSITIPCVAGPYTGLNATLRLLGNKFRSSSIAKDGRDYAEKTEGTDDRFNTFVIPVSSIAASNSQNESGMFELNFKDERYLPFEGAGAISKWRLELPSFRQFDYNTISDVVLQVRYTASEGGGRLQNAASENVKTILKSTEGLGKNEGFFTIIDLRHDMATEWHKATSLPDENGQYTMSLHNVDRYIPYYLYASLKQLKATDIILVTDVNGDGFQLEEESFNPSVKIGGLNTYAITEQSIGIGAWKLHLPETVKGAQQLFMVIRVVRP